MEAELESRRIVDVWIGRRKTPYRSIGLILLATSFLILMVDPTQYNDHWSVNLIWITCCFSPFLVGLNLMFLSAKFDESNTVSMESGMDMTALAN